jgi:hypothetical protein
MTTKKTISFFEQQELQHGMGDEGFITKSTKGIFMVGSALGFNVHMAGPEQLHLGFCFTQLHIFRDCFGMKGCIIYSHERNGPRE